MTTVFSYFDAASGQFTGTTIEVSREDLLPCDPPGLAKIAGRFSKENRRVDLRPDDFGDGFPVVVPWQPPPPADTALMTWAWDAQSERWVGSPTIEAIALGVRAERARRLAACDWVVARSLDTGEPVPDVWRAYRQALRDVTEQSGFPASISWPTPPTA